MTSTQRFEGSSLEELLERVQKEHGHDVTIVAANKLRRGGIAGFFAKEKFEVIIEPSEDGPSPTADDGDFAAHLASAHSLTGDDLIDFDSLQSSGPLDLLDLVTMASDAEQEAAGRAAAANGSQWTDRPLRPSDRSDRPLRAPSTEGVSFASVLGEVVRSTGAGNDFGGAASGANDAVFSPITPVTSVPAARYADAATAPITSAMPVVATRGPDLVPAYGATTNGSLTEGSGPASEIVRRGFPAAVVAGSEDPIQKLLAWLAALPSAPDLPRVNGAVVAVAGDRAAALELARRMAAEDGGDPNEVLLATPEGRCRVVRPELRIASSTEASEIRRSWRRRRRTTFVAIDAGIQQRSEWAAEMLAALEPNVVWGTVSADRKAEDVACWLHGLGGIDALDLCGLESTVSPASTLATGAVIGRLDGQPATPRRWLELTGVTNALTQFAVA